MGMDLLVSRSGPLRLAHLLDRLRERNLPSTVIMVDGQLHAPEAPVAEGWRDVRLRTPAGILSVKRASGTYSVVVFGNADASLQAAQQTVADVISSLEGD